jgi:hypothetical protein
MPSGQLKDAVRGAPGRRISGDQLLNRIIIVSVLVLILFATVFRVRRAQRILEMGRDLIVIYFVAVLIMAAYWTWQNGF